MYSNHPLMAQYSQMESTHPSSARVAAYMAYLQTHSTIAQSRSQLYSEAHHANRENIDPQRPPRPAFDYPTMASQTQTLPFLTAKQLQLRLGNGSVGGRNALQVLSSNQYPGYYVEADAAGSPRLCSELASNPVRDPGSLRVGTLEMRRLSLGKSVASIDVCSLPKSGFGRVAKKAVKEMLDTLLPDEVAVVFSRGTQVAKINKEVLCSRSHFFANAFNGTFTEAQKRCIRLRDDFPGAVKAMLNFLANGSYTLDAQVLSANGYLTVLDLHVHAYVVGTKYSIPALTSYAIKQYVQTAAGILSLDFPSDIPGIGTDPADTPARALAETSYFADQSPATKVDGFLNSVVLLWKHTVASHDEMRRAVLELIKPCLNKLTRLRMFGTMVVEMEEFGVDLESSLEEDGLEVMVCGKSEKGGFVLGFAGRV